MAALPVIMVLYFVERDYFMIASVITIATVVFTTLFFALDFAFKWGEKQNNQ